MDCALYEGAFPGAMPPWDVREGAQPPWVVSAVAYSAVEWGGFDLSGATEIGRVGAVD